MLKMADACQRAGGQQTRFHEMHVQRHNNVTILYADIVNFTPLSEQLTASDLVKTLNELFGRFDQIAQVRQQQTILIEKQNHTNFWWWLRLFRRLFDEFPLIICRKINAYALKFWAIAIIAFLDCPYLDHSMLQTV